MYLVSYSTVFLPPKVKASSFTKTLSMPDSNTNEFNLNDDQIEKLADAIVNKLYIKQEEADAKFLADLEASGADAQVYIVKDDGSVLSELDQQIQMLENEFNAALRKELYNTAADLDIQLKKLKKQRDQQNDKRN